ncbi:MarR family transcriptional regulator [Gordonia neofelifaecis NRRL B-59395]|uniref:MarR family transcriptional regulator n=1 Tax=Gordonia neofelifaecis NRRL B-59395 TaxID=644548 RepID=F1YG44_9ACTN|nr:MarR family transcriptional regulator [Gordonia neofelifaecis NRRL B-59395]
MRQKRAERRLGDGALISRSLVRITRAVRRALGVQPLTSGQASTLWAIAELAPVRPTDLAEKESVTSPSMSKTIACLDRAGLVSRSADPNDGRVSRLDLTAAGRAYVADANSERISLYENALRRLPTAERETVVRAVTLLADTMCDVVADRTRSSTRRPQAIDDH